MDTDDIISNKMSDVLNKSKISGILLDGYLSNYHIDKLLQLDIPLVVVGNHKITIPVTKVSYNLKNFAYKVTKVLHETNGLDVFLSIEPFELAYTQELFRGYTEACHELEIVPAPYVFSHATRPQSVYGQMVKNREKPFNLFLATNTANAYLDVLHNENLPLEDYPILVFGFMDNIPSSESKSISFIPGCCDKLPQKASELINKLADGQHVESVILEPVVSKTEKEGGSLIEVKWQ